MVNDGKVEGGICAGGGVAGVWDRGKELELGVLGDGIQGEGMRGERRLEGVGNI